MNVGLQGVKLVDHLKPGFIPEIIDAGKVTEKIEAELLLSKFTGWLDLPESQLQSDFIAKISPLNNLKLLLELRSGFLKFHERIPSSSFF